MHVVAVDPLRDVRWAALQGLPEAGLFHSPPWIAALRDAYGFAPRAYVAMDATGAARGGIAFCEIDDPLGHRLVSLPFSDACDPLLTDPGTWVPLSARLATHRLPVTFRCLDDRFAAGEGGFQVTKRARWHTLSVTDPAETIRHRFDDATRRAIAKAERAGVVARPLEGDAGLSEFVRLHARLRKCKYRLLAQPPAFFAAIAEHFRPLDGWHPLGAYHGDRLLGATIYLRWRDTLYLKFNASDQEALELRPNNLLVWAGVLLAKALGCSALDLGPSDDNQPGLIRFKRQFGAAERELHFLRWTPPGSALQPAAELRGVLGELTQLLTAPAVPDEVTAAAGGLLYRFFA